MCAMSEYTSLGGSFWELLYRQKCIKRSPHFDTNLKIMFKCCPSGESLSVYYYLIFIHSSSHHYCLSHFLLLDKRKDDIKNHTIHNKYSRWRSCSITGWKCKHTASIVRVECSAVFFRERDGGGATEWKYVYLDNLLRNR